MPPVSTDAEDGATVPTVASVMGTEDSAPAVKLPAGKDVQVALSLAKGVFVPPVEVQVELPLGVLGITIEAAVEWPLAVIVAVSAPSVGVAAATTSATIISSAR